MNIPFELSEAIANQSVNNDLTQVVKNSKNLSDRYRKGAEKISYINEDYFVYLNVRMPATYSAISACLSNLPISLSIESLVDYGSGPGTALWAVSEHFPDIHKLVAVERNSSFISLGKRLAGYSSKKALLEAEWFQQDLLKLKDLPKGDLALMAYSLGEILSKDRLSLVDKIWEATNKALLIVEPGTPTGYHSLMEVRSHLIAKGGYLVAPCPMDQKCPLMGTKDWCHFAARLPRTSMHRKIKGGELNYEDEKYSYLIFSKLPVSKSFSRIIRRPQIRKGHISLTLCTSEGIQQKNIGKSQKELFQIARKKEWGDIL